MKLKVTILSLLLSCSVWSIDWQRHAKEDLNAIQGIIRAHHMGPVNPHDDDFLELLSRSYRSARRLLPQVDSYSSYSQFLSRFINAFDSPQMRLTFKREYGSVRWPGFIVKYQDNKYLIAMEGQLNGWEITHCNAQSVEDYIQTHLLPNICSGQEIPRAFDFTQSAAKERVAPYVGVYFPTEWLEPIEQMTISKGRRVQNIKLDWKDINTRELMENIVSNIWPTTKGIEVDSHFHRASITLPTFVIDNDQKLEQIKEVIEQAKNFTGIGSITIDLRGNRGGNSYWGTQLIRSLFGKDYYNYRKGKANDIQIRKSYIRLSEENKNFLANELNKSALSPTSSIYDKYLKDTLEKMDQALLQGEAYCLLDELPQDKSSRYYFTPHSRMSETQIRVKVDAITGGAAATFIKELHEIDPHIIVEGDLYNEPIENYGDSRSFALPSGFATFACPMKYFLVEKQVIEPKLEIEEKADHLVEHEEAEFNNPPIADQEDTQEIQKEDIDEASDPMVEEEVELNESSGANQEDIEEDLDEEESSKE